jgi:hypothetical protein
MKTENAFEDLVSALYETNPELYARSVVSLALRLRRPELKAVVEELTIYIEH